MTATIPNSLPPTRAAAGRMRLAIAWLCLLFAGWWPLAPASDEAPAPRESRVAAERLARVKTDHPRDTLRSFMQAMDRYAQALEAGERRADDHLADAVRCLDLSQVNAVGREAIARDAARHLKEVIDRVIVVDYDKVPDDPTTARWRLRYTEITIARVASGERAGEHLFSPDTVARAAEFYQRVRDLPLLPGTLGGGLRLPWQERYIPPALQGEALGVATWQWLAMGILIFVGLIVRQLVKALAFIVQSYTARTAATWDDQLVAALKGPVTHLGTTGIWFVSLHFLGITGTAYTVIAFLIKGAFFINIAYLAYNLAGFLGSQCERRVRDQHPELNPGILSLLTQTMKILALVFCLLLGAENMGFNVAGLIAGLGIGGLAVALAAKDTLANLLGSVMIMIDRPFRIGDFIIARGVEGTVETIGFRSTRIRTPANSLVSVPNAELALANIDNLGMREYRRVRETYNLVFGTPPERIIAFCAGVRDIIAARPEAKPDAIVVRFTAIGASSLDVLVSYHIKVPGWAEEQAVREAVLCEVLRLAERLGVGFAFPTQTVHVHQEPAAAARPAAPSP